MKKTVIIVFCSIISLLCLGQNSLNDLKNDTIISKCFYNSDLNSLLVILNLYDNMVVEKTGISDINLAYHQFSEKVNHADWEERMEYTRLPPSQLDSIVLTCHKSRIINEIWKYHIWNIPQQVDTLNFRLRIRAESHFSYGKFLNELAKQECFSEYDDYLGYYIGVLLEKRMRMEGFETIPADDHELYDFNKMHWRLFYAIHFITEDFSVEYQKIDR